MKEKGYGEHDAVFCPNLPNKPLPNLLCFVCGGSDLKSGIMFIYFVILFEKLDERYWIITEVISRKHEFARTSETPIFQVGMDQFNRFVFFGFGCIKFPELIRLHILKISI